MAAWHIRPALAAHPPGELRLDLERADGLRAMRTWLQCEHQLMLWRSGVTFDYPVTCGEQPESFS